MPGLQFSSLRVACVFQQRDRFRRIPLSSEIVPTPPCCRNQGAATICEVPTAMFARFNRYSTLSLPMVEKGRVLIKTQIGKPRRGSWYVKIVWRTALNATLVFIPIVAARPTRSTGTKKPTLFERRKKPKLIWIDWNSLLYEGKP